MTILLSSLIYDAQRAADMINSSFVSIPTWIAWATQAESQLYGKVFSVYKDTFYKATVPSGASPPTSYPDIVLVNGVGNNVVTLPTDFRALRGLSQDPDLASRKTIPKFNFAERDYFRNGTGLAAFGPSSNTKAYRVVARSTLIVEPPENCGGTYRLYYVNGPTAFGGMSRQFVIGGGDLPVVSGTSFRFQFANGAFSSPADLGAGLLVQFDTAHGQWSGAYTVSAVISSTVVEVVGAFPPPGLFTGTPSGTVTVFAAATNALMPELEPWQEYVSQAMARKALLKEESDISAVDQRMAEIVVDLQTETETDENQVDSVVDVEGDAGFGWSRRVW